MSIGSIGSPAGVAGEEEVRSAFVRDIAARAELPPAVTAESVAAAVMCAIVERLTAGGAHRVLEALPASIKPLFEPCTVHRHGPVRKFDRPELLDRMGAHLGVTPREAERLCESVLAVVRSRLPHDVAMRIGQQLPGDLKELWFAPLPPAVGRVSQAPELERIRTELYAEIEASGGIQGGADAARSFEAVMCIFSQRLSGGQSHRMLLALPATIRPLVEGCMLHRERAQPFGERGFLDQVAAHLGIASELAEPLAHAVFAAVKRRLPEKDAEDAASQLPTDLRAVWIAS
jgi:uncharacterized protein (DUF2267 family)